MNPVIVARFWNKVEKTEGCWLWKASIGKSYGYGQFAVRHGQIVLVHRFAYEITHGPIPRDKRWCICHTCDNKLCVNLKHLWLGTDADNSADKIQKGRNSKHVPPSGEKHRSAKLTAAKVLTMRQMYSEGKHSIAAIGRLFGVSQGVASRIINKHIWKGVR